MLQKSSLGRTGIYNTTWETGTTKCLFKFVLCNKIERMFYKP